MSRRILKTRINIDGSVVAVYSDDLLPILRKVGRVEIRRASHVEPTPDGQWEADLSPMNGPRLGPFSMRGQALDAEAKWLDENIISVGR